MSMKFVYASGGREKYFKADNVGDCVTRAIVNATGKDYKEVYDKLNEMAKHESVKRHRGHKRSQSRNGVFKETWKRYLRDIGWIHHSVTSIGNDQRRKRLVEEDLPMGTLIVQLSKHVTCVKDKVIYDTYNCSKKEYYDWETGDKIVNEERCIYGYWTAPTEEQKKMQEESKAQIEEYKQFVANEKAQLAIKRAEVKKHNQAITKKYSKRINKLRAQLRKLERERDKQLLEMPKLERNTWAKKNAGLVS